MNEKRAHPRRRVRLIVDFETGTGSTTGITHDISRSGLFVRTVRIPKVGARIEFVLHLSGGQAVRLSGRVMRTFSAPGTLRFVVPSGFGIRLSPGSPGYKSFVGALFG